jgi:hypothetical protein
MFMDTNKLRRPKYFVKRSIFFDVQKRSAPGTEESRAELTASLVRRKV